MGVIAPADIVARHYRGVYRYLARVTGSRDRAEDLTQEVFLRVARAARNGDNVGHERGWVFAIARTVLAAEYRSAEPPATVEVDVDVSTNGNQAMIAELSEALGRLSHVDRDVLLLREVSGLTYVEIAEACECTVESVRARLRRTRCALRAALSWGRSGG